MFMANPSYLPSNKPESDSSLSVSIFTNEQRTLKEGNEMVKVFNENKPMNINK